MNEEKIKRERDKYLKYLEISKMIILSLNRKGEIIFTNKKTEEFLGYKKEELIGKSWFNNFIPKKERLKVKEVFKKIIDGKIKPVENYENSILTKNNQERRISWKNSIIKDKKNQIQEIISSGEDISDLIQTKELLNESNDKYKFLVDKMQEIAIILDKTGKVIFANNFTFKILECSKKELVGNSIFNFLTKKSLKDSIYNLNQKFLGNSQGVLEVEIKTKTGKVKTFLLGEESNPIYEKGIITELLITGIDISEQKKTIEALKESEESLQRIIDLLPSRIFWKDKNSIYLGCNIAFAEDAGKEKPSELIGKDDFQMNWKEQANSYRNDDKQVIKKKISKINFEEKQTLPNGNIVWLKTSKVPLTTKEGNVKGILGTYTDITEKKEIEEKIIQEQTMNKIIIDSMPGAFYILNKTGNYVKWNKYQGEIIGKPEEKILGMNALETIHPEDRELIQSKIINVLKKGTVEIVEGRILLKGGPNYIWMLLTGQRIFLDRKPFLIGSGIDITERKNIEKETEKFNKFAIGRELQMIELKKEIQSLKEKLKVKENE